MNRCDPCGSWVFLLKTAVYNANERYHIQPNECMKQILQRDLTINETRLVHASKANCCTNLNPTNPWKPNTAPDLSYVPAK